MGPSAVVPHLARLPPCQPGPRGSPGVGSATLGPVWKNHWCPSLGPTSLSQGLPGGLAMGHTEPHPLKGPAGGEAALHGTVRGANGPQTFANRKYKINYDFHRNPIMQVIIIFFYRGLEDCRAQRSVSTTPRASSL